MSTIGQPNAFAALLGRVSSADSANARTQGAMMGAAANVSGQTKDAREKGRNRAMRQVGNAARKKHAITDALQRPSRKGRA
ncbi:MAG: hypothetical protein AAFY60_10750 [Myxococcota bacterium]